MYWITGIGGVSPLGGTASAIKKSLRNLEKIENSIETSKLGPIGLAEYRNIDVSSLCKRKQDLRLLSQNMKAALQAASQALASAGLADCSDELSEMHIYSANSSGTRLQDVDCDIVNSVLAHEEGAQDVELNNAINANYRPTEFLTQIPNLMAANICMLKGIKGASRTLMGGQRAGSQAVDMAARALANGRAERCLVGGANFAGCFYSKLALCQAFERAQGNDDFAVGKIFSSSAFYFVLETPEAAKARGAKPLAEIDCVDANRPFAPEATKTSEWEANADRLVYSRDPRIEGAQEVAGSDSELAALLSRCGAQAKINSQEAYGYQAEAMMAAAIVTEVIHRREAWTQADAFSGTGCKPGSSLVAQIGLEGAPLYTKVKVH